MTNSTKILAACGVVAGFAVMAALPGVGHAVDPDTADTVINANVNTAISITAQAEVTIPTLNVNDLKTVAVAGTTAETAAFNVATNNTSGYTVKVAGTDSTDLTHATLSDAKIPYQKTALAKGTSGWNLDVTAGPTGVVTGIADITDSDTGYATIASTGAASAEKGDNYAVTYGAATNARQAAGAYQGKVTYTATIKE